MMSDAVNNSNRRAFLVLAGALVLGGIGLVGWMVYCAFSPVLKGLG